MFPHHQQQQRQQQSDETFIGFMAIQGRNGSDHPLLMPDRQCLEALNVDWFRSGLGRKRGGASTLANGFKAVAMYRHVPSDNQALAELWVMDDTGVLHRYSGGAWSTPTMVDACTASPQETYFQTFNGKLFISYKNAHNRLHVWDPNGPSLTTSVRRVGLDLPAAPTAGAPSGTGVTATRKYRVSWCKQNASNVTIQRSNLGPASGSVVLANQQVVVTRPAAPGEGETHWELWEAQDANFSDYRLLGTTVIATTTFTDNISTQPATVSPAEGANTPPPSVKYLVADTNRILMGGVWEAQTNTENAMVPSVNRLYWTSAKGSSDIGDDERVSNTGTINNYADISEAIVAISQPMQLSTTQASSLERGSFYTFSAQSQWKFVSTTSGETGPYLQFKITGGSGCIHHKSLLIAQDSNGNPSLMWGATAGIYRLSTNGQEYCGQDNTDLWATLNRAATIPVHAMFYPDKHQVWFYFATGTKAYPTQRLVFDTLLGKVADNSGVRLGWSHHTGEQTNAYCSTLFADTLGATVSLKLVPHIGYSGVNKTQEIWKCDTSDLNDVGVSFQAYIDSKSYAPWGLGRKGGMSRDASLVANTASGVGVDLTIYRNEGAGSESFRADLSAVSDSESETTVFPTFSGSQLADSYTLRCRIGDLVATDGAWNLHGLILPVDYQGDR